MSGQEHNLVGCSAAAKNGDGIPGLFAGCVFELRQALLEALGQRVGEWSLLQKGAVVATGVEAERLELSGGEEGGDVLVACGGAAAVEFIVREELHVCMNFSIKHRTQRCRLSC
jgi:hypothetical protein